MFKAFYAGMELSALPLFALGFFLLFFTAVLLHVLIVRRPRDFAAVAALPLDDSEKRR